MNTEHKRWLQEEIDYIKDNYETLTIEEMVNYIGRSKSSIVHKASRLNVYRPTYSGRRYNIDHNFFSSYTQGSCYVAGFIAADGNISKQSVGIDICNDDIEVINYILESMKCESKVDIRTRWGTKYSRIRFSSKNIVDCLYKNFNITERKSLTLEYPTQIPEDMHRHFIRGYFDGDGWFYIQNLIPKSCGIISTKNFICSAKQIIEKNTEVKIKTIRTLKNGITTTMTMSGQKAIDFCDWIYEGAEFYLSRKHENYFISKESYSPNRTYKTVNKRKKQKTG